MKFLASKFKISEVCNARAPFALYAAVAVCCFTFLFRQIVRPKHIPNDGQVRSDRRKISRLDKNPVVKIEKPKKSQSLAWIVRQLTIRLVQQSSNKWNCKWQPIKPAKPVLLKSNRFRVKLRLRKNQVESFWSCESISQKLVNQQLKSKKSIIIIRPKSVKQSNRGVVKKKSVINLKIKSLRTPKKRSTGKSYRKPNKKTFNWHWKLTEAQSWVQ